MRGTVQLYGGSFSGMNITPTRSTKGSMSPTCWPQPDLSPYRRFRSGGFLHPDDLGCEGGTGPDPRPLCGRNRGKCHGDGVYPDRAHHGKLDRRALCGQGERDHPRECDRFRGHAGHHPLRRGEPDGAGRHHPPRWEPCAPDHLRPDRRDGNHDRHEQERRGRHDG